MPRSGKPVIAAFQYYSYRKSIQQAAISIPPDMHPRQPVRLMYGIRAPKPCNKLRGE